MTRSSFSQPEKAASPIACSDGRFCKFMVVRFLHPSNAFTPISFSMFGSVILDNFLQSENAPYAMAFIAPFNDNSVMSSQPWNVIFGRVSRSVSTIADFSELHPLNTYSPRESTNDGMTSVSNPLRSKAWSPIYSLLLPDSKSTDFRARFSPKAHDPI